MSMEMGKKILVVDDEEDVRLFLQTALEDAGFTVETACDGIEALEKVKSNPPDAISLDLVMPRKSGARFLYELRKNSQWKDIPIILVTAHASDDLGSGDFRDIMSGKTIQGPETYLEKPVTAQTYVNSIKRALGLKKSISPAGTPEDSSRDMKEEIRDLIGDADPAKLKEVLRLLKENEEG
jgi:two-component system alkaline phosphatase synthesis response regulator PhoP